MNGARLQQTPSTHYGREAKESNLAPALIQSTFFMYNVEMTFNYVCCPTVHINLIEALKVK